VQNTPYYHIFEAQNLDNHYSSGGEHIFKKKRIIHTNYYKL